MKLITDKFTDVKMLFATAAIYMATITGAGAAPRNFLR